MVSRYMGYEDPSFANENSRKLGVFDRKLGGTTPFFSVSIVMNIRENETIMLKLGFLLLTKFIRFQNYNVQS